MKEIIKLTQEHIEAIEAIYERDEFTLTEVIEYIDTLNLEDRYKYPIEVIPATRREFSKNILCTIYY